MKDVAFEGKSIHGLYLVRTLKTYSKISSVTSSISLKDRSSQAMFSGHSTRSKASWYKPWVSTRLLLESLMTLLLYLLIQY